MKKIKLIIVLVIIIRLVSLGIFGCSSVIDKEDPVTITSTEIDDSLHLIIKYSNGETKDMGYVGIVDTSKNVTVTKTEVTEELHLIITFSNGTTEDLGYIGVVDESLNVVVSKTEVNEAKHLIVTYSDGTSEDKGYVGVIDESLNIVVTKTEVNNDKHLIVTYSNGTTEDMGYVGVIDESLNVIVSKTEVNDDLHLIVTYSNGTTEDKGYVGVIDESLNVVVVKSEVNSELHLIVTYSNGNTEDLGYVGVEVIPPLYMVRFLDINGNVLKEQEVYKGRSASAPTAPTVADKQFSRWDKEYTNIQGDVDIRAIYTDNDSFTVTFKDENGTVLKTESVLLGHNATAPTVGNTENKIFTGWNKTFTNIQEDTVVTAVYRLKNNYVVTFKDYSGITLGTANVKELDTAVAPVTPTREGYTFTGWSSSLTKITSSKTVTAQYSLISGTNILDISYTVSGSSLVVTMTLKGIVKVCGMEGSIVVPSGLTYVKAEDGSGVSSGYSNGVISYMFSSNNGRNVTSQMTVIKITFTIDSNASDSVTLQTIISDIYDEDFVDMNSKVIGQVIRLK